MIQIMLARLAYLLNIAILTVRIQDHSARSEDALLAVATEV